MSTSNLNEFSYNLVTDGANKNPYWLLIKSLYSAPGRSSVWRYEVEAYSVAETYSENKQKSYSFTSSNYSFSIPDDFEEESTIEMILEARVKLIIDPEFSLILTPHEECIRLYTEEMLFDWDVDLSELKEAIEMVKFFVMLHSEK